MCVCHHANFTLMRDWAGAGTSLIDCCFALLCPHTHTYSLGGKYSLSTKLQEAKHWFGLSKSNNEGSSGRRRSIALEIRFMNDRTLNPILAPPDSIIRRALHKHFTTFMDFFYEDVNDQRDGDSYRLWSRAGMYVATTHLRHGGQRQKHAFLGWFSPVYSFNHHRTCTHRWDPAWAHLTHDSVPDLGRRWLLSVLSRRRLEASGKQLGENSKRRHCKIWCSKVDQACPCKKED